MKKLSILFATTASLFAAEPYDSGVSATGEPRAELRADPVELAAAGALDREAAVKQAAIAALPELEKWYSHDELLSIFMPVVHDALHPYFKEFLDTLFTDEFGMPKHKNPYITKGWRCLYGKMLNANVLVVAEETITAQKLGIDQIKKFHPNAIKRVHPDADLSFLKDVPGCIRCLGAEDA